MSTIVMVPNCLEAETTTTTTTLKLRVAGGDHTSELELGGWGFLHKNSSPIIDKDSSYTHPLSRSSRLSPQSLQLCTENLGSESGSDTFSDCSSIFSASPPPSPTRDRAVFSHDCAAAQRKPSPSPSPKLRNFPPPLTTMTGASSLQVRRRSDGGRLIIDAVEGPFRNSYLHAERCDGRLRLSFANCAAAAEQEIGENEEEEAECGAAEGEIEDTRNGFESEKEELDGEMNLLEKFQRFSRCKEGGAGHGTKGLCSNWKPATLWVATS